MTGNVPAAQARLRTRPGKIMRERANTFDYILDH